MSGYRFGEELADARRRNGLSVQQVSDALRIRPDIIRAIEMEDFARMPAKGFARNQVSAYARYLGLDSVDFTDRFLASYNDFERSAASLDYVVDHQQPSNDRAYATARKAQNNRDYAERQRRGHSGGRSGGSRSRLQRSSGGPRRETTAQRRARDDTRADGRARYATPKRGGRSHRSGDRNIGSRGFNPSGNRFPLSRLVVIVIAIVLIILIIFGISRCSSGSSDSNTTQTTQTTTSQNSVQVTGGQESGVVLQDQDANALTTMPDVKTQHTQIEATVSLASGDSSSLQIDVDGQTVVYDTVTGPSEEKYTATNSFVIQSFNPSAVKVTAGGKDYSFKTDSDGLGTISLKLVDGKIVQD